MDKDLKSPAVSIVVPVFNTAPFLKKCLSSLQNQSFGNLEILLVDDASPDGAVDIARDFMAVDNRFKLLRHTCNQGLGPSRNTGIQNAAAPWVMFVDSDDWIDRDCVEKLYRAVMAHNADMAQCGTKWVYPGHSFVRPTKATSFGIIRGREVLLTYNRWNISASILCMTWGKLYRKELFLRNNIRFPNIIGEDVPTTFQLCYFARKAVVLSKPYYYYRQRHSSITGAETSERNIRDLFIGLKIIYDFINLHLNAAGVEAHYNNLAYNQVIWWMLYDIKLAYFDQPAKFLQLLRLLDRYYLAFQPMLRIDGPYLKYSLRFAQEVDPGLPLVCLRSYWKSFPRRQVIKAVLDLVLFRLGVRVMHSKFFVKKMSVEKRKLLKRLYKSHISQ